MEEEPEEEGELERFPAEARRTLTLPQLRETPSADVTRARARARGRGFSLLSTGDRHGGLERPSSFSASPALQQLCGFCLFLRCWLLGGGFLCR